VTSRAPVEFKVVAGTSGAGAGFVVSQFVLWLLGGWVWGASWTSNAGIDAIAAVPQPAAEMIGLVVTVIGAYVFGWLAPHTSRPVPLPPDPVPTPVPIPPKPITLDHGLDVLHTEPVPEV
jgi:hypothetical protein